MECSMQVPYQMPQKVGYFYGPSNWNNRISQCESPKKQVMMEMQQVHCKVVKW